VHAALQAEDQKLGVAGQGEELGKRCGALANPAAGQASRPVDADAQLGLFDATELDAAARRRMQIGGLGREGGEVGAAEMGAATPPRHADRSPAASSPSATACVDEVDGRQKLLQQRLAEHQYGGAAAFQLAREAHEQQHVRSGPCSG